MVGAGREEAKADAARAQAALFLAQVEDVATQLELQVTALERTAAMRAAKNAERLRRLQLYEARRQIDALNSRFPGLDPRSVGPGDRTARP